MSFDISPLTSQEKITAIYISYYDRAPDPAGLEFWVGQLDSGRSLEQIATDFSGAAETRAKFPFFNEPEAAGTSANAFITSVYINLFGRTPDDAGRAFWVNQLESGSTPVGEIILAIIEGAQDVEGGPQDQTTITNKIDVGLDWAESAQNAGIGVTGAEAIAEELNGELVINDEATFNSATSILGGVDATVESVTTAKNTTYDFFADDGSDGVGVGTGEVFTLTEIREDLPDSTPTQMVIYWGNPETGEGVPAGQVWGALNDYLSTATDMSDNLFDINDSLSEIRDITIVGVGDDLQGSGPLASGDGAVEGDVTGSNQGDYTGNYEITVELSDGTINSAIVELTQEQFDYLNGLLFDTDGNSRLFEQEVAFQVQAKDQDGNLLTDVNDEPILVDAEVDGGFIDYPIVLTTAQNNGGTEERGYTSDSNEVIVAGRLDLLHGAYIDGGGGDNTLQIDAKGHFAQPKQLLNIQNIEVQNLPNIYTRVDADGNIINDYPDVQENADADNDSIIDLSRAVDLETMLITQGDFEDLAGQAAVGDLTLTGISNGAIVTLDGHFDTSGDVRLNYTGSSPADGISVVFNNLNMMSDLEVAHNATRLNIESTGAGNYVFAGDLGGNDAALRDLVITGDAYLHIDGDLDNSFQDNSPVIIDASANTGGVDLELQNSEQVTFLGSQGDDRFTVETDESNAGSVNVGGSDQSVTILDMLGDNYLRVDSNNIDITIGDGDNTLELGGETQNDSGDLSIATVVAGNGNNDIVASTLDVVNITAGDGDNKIGVNANDITITTGAGEDTVIVSGQGGISDLEDSNSSGISVNNTAMLNIDVGAGENTVVLGGDVTGVNYSSGVTALGGSSISGENITLYVEEPSDLRAAELSGIERVTLDLGTSSQITGDDAVGNASINPVLTLTDTQLAAIGAENFSVDGAAFDTYAQLKIIVTESTSLTDLGVDDLPAGVDLQLELRDGVQLEMTAEQLHTKVAPQGVTLANDNNTDQLSGSVLVTGAGTDFDPFNNSDQVRTNIDGQVYYGGSLSTVDFSSDTAGDGVQRSEW
ncbi:MAG: DUF4214 domain-containing protein, partial [Actinobacteria bacterium]|nr:DUF4214 domain-containing protein [Actinomycetota bacterium]